MKPITSFAILLNFAFTGIASGYAASTEDCKGINHPAYQTEYRACLRSKIAASATEAGVDCVDCLFDQEKAE